VRLFDIDGLFFSARVRRSCGVAGKGNPPFAQSELVGKHAPDDGRESALAPSVGVLPVQDQDSGGG